MNKIIVPGPKSVLTPEKQYEAYGRTAEMMRDTLFVGAVMGMAETVHESGEYKDCLPEQGTMPVVGSLTLTGASDAADLIQQILAIAFHNKWNVAVEMLNWKKQYIANKIKEKIDTETKKPSE